MTVYDITSIVVDPEQVAIRLKWSYTLPEGQLSGTHVLLQPPGGSDLAEASKADLIGWLTSQLQNTEEEFTEYIQARAAAELAEASLSNFPVPE
mgnify:CR=1 FL=1|tara:strand:- start:507 stop:788 length:282 start_codon:yes stop_codon:yes gene_type:complete